MKLIKVLPALDILTCNYLSRILDEGNITTYIPILDSDFTELRQFTIDTMFDINEGYY